MRRALVVSALLLLGVAGAPPSAVATPERAACEGYCAFVGGGCYVFMGIFIGKDKCESMYKGCVEGCVAGLLDPEPERE
ncbi:MAG: hypothetical protein PVG79_16280 [Gemmatimonadales bacterium]|jgi:hypothetical protein